MILILHSLSSYGSSAVPSWVSINLSTGVLTITASPNVSSNTEFDFYVTSTISGVASPVNKLIKLTVTDDPPQNSQTQNNSQKNSQAQNWQVQNCQQWSNLVSSIWIVWASGFTLNSGVWNSRSKVSSTAQLLGITIIASILAISCITILGSTIDASSIANLWAIVNQSKML